ncbi:MAG: hybrid sensor histidine kinase/response regulator [Candidatus Promineifilaceae bacterium]|nr:hybrid sensor histidine kinase/response regulator [Candidatus Promineifilaceae bacterium]
MPDGTSVLYIEDDIGSQRLVQRVLERHGYDVAIAGEGMEGIDLARQTQPQIILMDINLPGMNGREITTRLRSLPNFRQVPIIALTANTSPGHRERALAAGCDGYITKPINVVQFPQEVETFLQGHRERLEEQEKIQHLELHAQQLVSRLEDKIRELEEANEELRELDRMKSSFIVLVSHELRTPLTLLEGYAHLLEEHANTGNADDYPPGLLDLVNGLDTGVKRISQVISEIINVSRIASGRLEISVGPVRLASIVDEILDSHAETTEQRDLRVQVDDLSDLPLIQGDGGQLAIAIGNVLENAIKYTPDGGRIAISGRAVGDAVDLVISDTGIGIPHKEQRRIFDHFHILESIQHHSTSKSAYKGGGLGLGLAIARGIIDAHNGRIWVESKGRDTDTNPGSTFHLLLPVKQEEAPDLPLSV